MEYNLSCLVFVIVIVLSYLTPSAQGISSFVFVLQN